MNWFSVIISKAWDIQGYKFGSKLPNSLSVAVPQAQLAVYGGIRMKRMMDLFLTFGRIGALTFGGGYAMLSLLDYECVEKRKWC